MDPYQAAHCTKSCTFRFPGDQRTNIASDMTGDNDSPQFHDLLAYAEEIDEAPAFISMPLEAAGRSGALHDTASSNHFPVNENTIPCCESFPNPQLDSNTNYFQIANLGAGQHDDQTWTDDALLQSLFTDQPVDNHQLFDDYISPGTSSTNDIINFKQPVSTPLAKDSLQNSRGLPRRRSHYRIQQIGCMPNAVFIPPGQGPADPLERWKQSPPEEEAVSFSAIRKALETSSPRHKVGQRVGIPGSRANDAFQHHWHSASRAASTASGESGTSASSRHSYQSNRSSLSNSSQTIGDKKSSGVRKRRTDAKREKRSSANNPRIFCCTFCCDKFKNKYDWMRHEKSLHLNLESWTCAPFGGAVVLPSTGRTHCAYCNQLDPTPEHLDNHNHGHCQYQNKSIFRRKDHLIQHLRHFHRLDTIPLIDDWRHTITDFASRCGFCNERMSTWNERADHLTTHFRKGCTMVQWKGDHAFPPEIATQVTNSVPPYLLDFESRTFVPFSATDKAVNDHLSQMLSRATFENESGKAETSPEFELLGEEVPPLSEPSAFEEPRLDSYTEVLTRHLSHYAQQMMSNGVIPTDEMFQSEARRLLFDSEDQWNQTMADNHEWLAQFREEQDSPLEHPQ
jgi:hypothetical protein